MELTTNIFKNEVRVAYNRACALIPDAQAERTYIKLAKQGNRAAREAIFARQLPALIDLASGLNYAMYTGNCAELVSVAMQALDKAIEGFDLNSGCRFWTFFYPKALNEMNKEKYEDRLIHVPENYVKKGRANELASIESGNTPVQDEDGACLFDLLTGDTGDSIVDAAAQTEYEDITERILGVLNPQELDVVSKCYRDTEPDTNGDASCKNWNVNSIARFYGMSKEIIRNRHKRALTKLRAELDLDRDWCIDQKIA